MAQCGFALEMRLAVFMPTIAIIEENGKGVFARITRVYKIVYTHRPCSWVRRTGRTVRFELLSSHLES